MNHKTISHFIFEYGYNRSLDHMDSHAPEKGEVCSYCGHPYKQMVSMNQLELARYNNWHLHKERDSKSFCFPCAFVLRTDDFRRKALIATTGGVHFFQRKSPQDWELLTKFIFYVPPAPPFVISVPFDYRKHIVLRAKINYKKAEFHVQFGEDTVIVHPATHKSVYEAVKHLYEAGAAPIEILHKAYSRKTHSDSVVQLEDIISPWRYTPLLSLILELAKPASGEG